MMGFVEQEIRERRWRDYVEALEEERRKIQVFQRELPLCLQLVNQTIASFRQQQQMVMMVCDEDMCSEVPVLEEFIPIKRSSTVEEEEEEGSHENQSKDVTKAICVGQENEEDEEDGEQEEEEEEEKEKLDWFQSVQLSIKPPNTSNEIYEERKPTETTISLESNKARGAFHPFNRVDQKRITHSVEILPTPTPEAAAASSSGSGSRRSSDEKDQGQSNRKARRCWSPELHRRFLHALQQLGGSHVATPKQIRELMNVDGLTNDEVKSHLQKYRLHTKRPSTASQESGGGSSQTPQVVLVGGLWVTPPEYSTVTTASPEEQKTDVPTNRIYAPVALLPGRKCNDTNSNNRDGGRNSLMSSPATSCSSLTVTTSPQM